MIVDVIRVCNGGRQGGGMNMENSLGEIGLGEVLRCGEEGGV